MSNTQVELKKVVYALSQGHDKLTCSFEPTGYSKYVRFDLVEKLVDIVAKYGLDYSVEDRKAVMSLTELLGEME